MKMSYDKDLTAIHFATAEEARDENAARHFALSEERMYNTIRGGAESVDTWRRRPEHYFTDERGGTSPKPYDVVLEDISFDVRLARVNNQ